MLKRIIAIAMLCVVFVSSSTIINAGTTVCSDSPDGKHHMHVQGPSTMEVGTSKVYGENILLNRLAGYYECRYCGDGIVVEGTHPNYYVGDYIYSHDFYYFFDNGIDHRVVVKSYDDIHYTSGTFRWF